MFRVYLLRELHDKFDKNIKDNGKIIQPEEAENFIQKYDHERDNLMRSIFHKNINDWSLYDIIINTAHFTAAAASEIVIDAVDEIQKVPDPIALKEKLANMALAKRIETQVRRKLNSPAAQELEITAESAGLIRLTGRVRSEQDRGGHGKNCALNILE